MKFSESVSRPDTASSHTDKRISFSFLCSLVILLLSLSFLTNSSGNKVGTELIRPENRHLLTGKYIFPADHEQYQVASPFARSDIASFIVFPVPPAQISCAVQAAAKALFAFSMRINNISTISEVFQSVQKSNKRYGAVLSA